MSAFLRFKLWLGTLRFRSTRADIYQALLESISQRVGSAPVPVLSLIQKWEERDRERRDDRHLVYAHIARRLASGYVSFADAVRPFVDDDEYLILSSAEQGSGGLEKALQLAIRNAEAKATMKSEFGSALAEPASSFLSLLSLSMAMGLAVWPDFLAAVPRKYWSTSALICIDTQIWIARNWMWLLVPVIALTYLYFWALPRWTGKFRAWADLFPPWSVYRSRQAASLLSVLATLLLAGRTVREALVTVRGTSSPYLAWRISQMLHIYDTVGENSLDCVKTGFFGQGLVDRISDASENRNFGPTLTYVGGDALRQVIKEAVTYAKAAGRGLSLVFGMTFIFIIYVTFTSTQEATDALMHGAKFLQKGG